MYKRTQDLNIPVRRHVISLKWALNTHSLPLAFKTEINERTARQTVSIKSLYPRDFTDAKIDNPDSAYHLKFNYPCNFGSKDIVLICSNITI
jgi:hypothetical protein